jgi:hypothetical protein
MHGSMGGRWKRSLGHRASALPDHPHLGSERSPRGEACAVPGGQGRSRATIGMYDKIDRRDVLQQASEQVRGKSERGRHPSDHHRGRQPVRRGPSAWRARVRSGGRHVAAGPGTPGSGIQTRLVGAKAAIEPVNRLPPALRHSAQPGGG